MRNNDTPPTRVHWQSEAGTPLGGRCGYRFGGQPITEVAALVTCPTCIALLALDVAYRLRAL